MQKITPDEYRSLLALHSKKRNKYGARKTGSHASKKEHERAGQLKLMQAAGIISDLREQVKFLLLPSQNDPDGRLIERQVSYIADFVYKNSEGKTVVEDTKGYHTKEYIIKRKLMLHVHGIRITEI